MKIVSLIAFATLLASSSFAATASVTCSDYEVAQNNCPVVSKVYAEAQSECNKQLLDVAQVRNSKNQTLGYVCVMLPLN